ncbi:unnamed protein product [Calypogeia fissa]
MESVPSSTPRPFDDVESLLRRPFLGESNREAQPDPGSRPKRGASEIEKKMLDNCQPLDRTEDDHSVLYKAVVAVAIYFAVGILCFYFESDFFGVNTETFIDSLYFCVVTLSTVGYGDLVPSSTAGKLFTSLYVFVGFGLVGALVSGAANYIVELQEQMLVRALNRKEDEDYELAEETDVQNAKWKVFVSGILVLGLFISGVVFNIVIEGMTFVDSFYCVCVTVTTLGYGDHSFTTPLGRFFAAMWILSSTVCLAQFFLYIAEMRTQSRQLKLAHWVLHRKTTKTDLQAADIDGDGIVSAPEFVIFKLKELGKIDEEDVKGIMKEFQSLDCDRSGGINVQDLSTANQEGQSS